MGIKKSLRFEVFARDKFTCQYCGKMPPSVVLELDHIHPVCKGGSDETINLITACAECNNGKGAKIITEIASRPDADLAYLKLQQEAAEIQRFLTTKKKRDRLWKKACEALRETWYEQLTEYAPSDAILISWIRRYGAEEINTAILSAAEAHLKKPFGYTEESALRRLVPYVGAILRNRRDEKENDQTVN